MSRIGKRPIPVPNKVTVAIDGQHISVKGAKGSLERVIPSGVKVEQEENILTVTPVNDSRTSRAWIGTYPRCQYGGRCG